MASGPSLARCSGLVTAAEGEVRETPRMVVDNLKGNVFVNQYLIIKDLGRGAHGAVKLCLDTQDGEVYAMKVVQKKGPNRRRASYSIPTSTPMTPRTGSPDVWPPAAASGPRTSPLVTCSSNAGSLTASLSNTGGGTPMRRSLHFANAAAAAASAAAAAAAAGSGCETPSLGVSRVTPGWPVTGVSMASLDSSLQATPTAMTPTAAAAGGGGAGASFGSTFAVGGSSPADATAGAGAAGTAGAGAGSLGTSLDKAAAAATGGGVEQEKPASAVLDALLPASRFSSSSAGPDAAAAAASVDPGSISLEGAWAVAQRSSSTGLARTPSATPSLSSLPSNVAAALAGLSSIPLAGSGGSTSSKQVAAALQGLSTMAGGPLRNSSSSVSAGGSMNVAAALAGLSTAAAPPAASGEVCLPVPLQQQQPQPSLALPPGLLSSVSTGQWSASPGSASGCHTPTAAAGGGGGYMPADAATEQLMREMAVMKKLDHPNIVKLYEVIHDPEQRLLVMVMEYMPCGSVLQPQVGAPGRTQPLGEATARRYFRDVLQGLDYLHYNHIMHGDLKPENLLLSLDDVVKISDFGSCSTLHPAATISSTLGTPAFMAPEMCQLPAQRFRPFVAEMWALGVCLYMFMFGRVPYEACSNMKLYELIRSPDPVQLPSEASALSPELRGLLLGLLDKNPDQRLTLPQVFDHPWVTQHGAQVLHSCEELCGADNHQLATAVRVMASGREQNQALTSWGKQMKAALPSMEERTYKKKQVLVREGEVPEGMFLILKGKVELVHGIGLGAGGKKARKEGDADFASAMSDEASSTESEDSDSEEEEDEEDGDSVCSSGNWAIKAAPGSGSFSPLGIRLRPPQQQQMLVRQVGGGTGSSSPVHPPSGASSPAPATPTSTAGAANSTFTGQQSAAARSTLSSNSSSRRTTGASWWGLWEAAAAASRPKRRRTDPKEHPAPRDCSHSHLQQLPSMPNRPCSKRRTASMDYQHYAAMQAQRSVASFTGAQGSAAQQVLVQRSAASATVMARAVRRSESMHIRMKQLVEVAKARTTQKRGGEDLVVTRGPGQVVGDTSMGMTRSPATATARAKTKVKVLLVRPQDMGILRSQPQVKAALARTQTESNILDVLESFASYDEEVTAIDELRKVLASNGSLSLPNGTSLAGASHSRQGSFSMTGGASLLLAPGSMPPRAGSPMGPNGGGSPAALGVFREGSFSTAALSRQGSGVLRPGTLNISAAVLGQTAAAAGSSGLASPRRNGGGSPARTTSNVRVNGSSSPPPAAAASLKRVLSIGSKRSLSIDRGEAAAAARSILSREASSSNLAGEGAPISPRGGPTSPRGFAAPGGSPWSTQAAEGEGGAGGAGGLRSPRATGGLAAQGSSRRGAWAFHAASSSSSRSFSDRPGSPDMAGGAGGVGGGGGDSPPGSFTAAGGLARQPSNLSHASSISPSPSMSAPSSPEPGARPDPLAGGAAGAGGTGGGPQQQQHQQQQQMLSHARMPSRSSTRSKTRLRSGISWTELGAAGAAGGVTGAGVGHTRVTAEAMQQLRASFQAHSPREQA